MKLIALLVSFCLCQDLFAQEKQLTVFDQLVYVNKEWEKQTDAPAWLRNTPAQALDAQEIVQFHLQQVESLLRSRAVSGLTIQQQQQRTKHLDVLHAYWGNGVFPLNTHHTGRQPYFIDEKNTYCAVGYLMKMSGADEMARSINQTQNFNYLADIHHPGLMDWVNKSGLSLSELALIQPGYGWEHPAVLLEMHYNNAGTDVNEYIEIVQSNGQLIGMFSFDSVIFKDQSGVVYKRLPRSSMTYSSGSDVYYYIFPANENFADVGSFLIKAIYPANQWNTEIFYNSTSVTVTGKYCNSPTPPVCPNQSLVYAVGESETTPVGNTLGFSGTYTKPDWALVAGPHSMSVQNPSAFFLLPVALSKFNYTISGRKVILDWETATENNSSHFVVERSTDGNNFQAIGTVAAAGNSNDLRRYSFTDVNPDHINQYRLRQVDIDGKFKYSAVLYVKMQAQNPVTIVNNPVKDILKISVKEAEPGTMIIYDMMGKKLNSFSVSTNGLFSFDISSIPAGTYLLAFTNKKGNVFNQLFIKAE